ncbi:MAG: hypothetical protein HYW47_06450 [Deltaproteobacteria bacterium]|nr:hypothetical protein [Deltaproteobacteria bacterium]
MGNELFNEVISLSGLPHPLLKEMLLEQGYDPENITLSQLRCFTEALLKDILEQ